jgi:D-alanyl-D-alanine carboxypeptidase
MMQMIDAARIVRCSIAVMNTAARRWFRGGMLLALALALWSASGAQARAQIGSERYSSIVIDAATGHELEATNADELRFPASLTKMMTLYLTFEALRDRRIALDTLVPVSPHAASMAPTKLGLAPGARITVEQAILGLVTQSANDAAAALGELLAGGSEPAFAALMTQKARDLGMTHTTFRNASGLPDPEQTSTARDLSHLALHLLTDFPDQYRYFSTPSFRFNGRLFANHDHLVGSYPGADGLKTGFTTASGFNVATSAVHGDIRLIGVVMGAARAAERDRHMAVLLDRGFAAMGEPPEHAHEELHDVALVARANAVPLPPPAPPARWTISLGSFGSEALARRAAENARKLAEAGRAAVSVITTHEGHSIWRAELTGVGSGVAPNACAALERHKMSCIILKPSES